MCGCACAAHACDILPVAVDITPAIKRSPSMAVSGFLIIRASVVSRARGKLLHL